MATVLNKEPKRKDTTVRIKKDDDEPHGLKFDFKHGPFGGGTQKQEYKNDGHPGFLIHFTIDDDARSGLLFPEDPYDALWVHPVQSEHDPCPPKGARWPVFNPERVEDGGRTLVVRNENRCYDLFKFSLNFTRNRGDPDAELVCWDPIGINRNGMTSLARADHAYAASVAVAGAAIGALATAAVLTRNKRD